MAKLGETIVAALLLGTAGSAKAAVINVALGEDVEAAIATAQPGDEVVIEGGMYTVTERFGIDLVATEALPIVIRSADGGVAHIHRPDAAQNIIDIDNATWVEIRGIEFSGGSAGIRISAADHLTIADCEIHSTNDVALRANDGGALYDSLHFVGNHIHDTDNTGEGMYLGCNDNGCQFANGVIERNYIHHTNQATVDQGDGIEIKEGSYNNVIADNVIHDTNYPCILTYSTVGNGAPNVIERNVMWNCGDHAIQSAADATIRNNIILSANVDGIAMQSHQSGNPANLTVVHNTILGVSGNALSLRDIVGAVVIANNALYAPGGNAIFIGAGDTAGLTVAGNVGAGGATGPAAGGYVDGNLMADFVAAHHVGAPPIDPFPAPGGALVGAGDAAYVPDDDFNTTLRGGVADVGAYLFDPDGNPGWTIAAEFKEFPDDGGADDGGTDDGGSDGSDADGGGDGVDDGADGTGGGDDGDDGADDGAGTGGTSSVDTESGGADGAGDDGGGCSCRSATPGPLGGLAWIGLLGLRRRRAASLASRATGTATGRGQLLLRSRLHVVAGASDLDPARHRAGCAHAEAHPHRADSTRGRGL